jgi:hypothetical protein
MKKLAFLTLLALAFAVSSCGTSPNTNRPTSTLRPDFGRPNWSEARARPANWVS